MWCEVLLLGFELALASTTSSRQGCGNLWNHRNMPTPEDSCVEYLIRKLHGPKSKL